MRNIIVCNWLSADGYIAGPNGEIDWFSWNEAIAGTLRPMQANVDLLLFGRKTHDLMEAYWPTPAAAGESASIRSHLNNTKKIVYSTTLRSSGWNNTTVENHIDAEAIRALKRSPGKDILIYGSAGIVTQLADLQLTDQYYFFYSPLLLGSGTPLTGPLQRSVKLTCNQVIPYDNGGVLIQYSGIFE